MGRPSKLTEQLQSDICEYIANGNTFERACRLCDISEAVFYSWKVRGDKEKEGKYLDFLESTKKAEEQFKATNIAIILKVATDSSWQAAAWLLERKYPEEFGRRDRMNIELNNLGDKLAKTLTGIGIKPK